jgi:hypothetical protein
MIKMAVSDADEKTIAYIANNNNHRSSFGDERQLAFAYSSLLHLLERSNAPERLESLENELHFYDVTGYPDFPLSKYYLY